MDDRIQEGYAVARMSAIGRKQTLANGFTAAVRFWVVSGRSDTGKCLRLSCSNEKSARRAGLWLPAFVSSSRGAKCTRGELLLPGA